MKNPNTRDQLFSYRIGLFILFVPAIYGLYFICVVWLTHQPYLLSEANPVPVLYDTVFYKSIHGRTTSRQCTGKRLTDGKKFAVHFTNIKARFSELSYRDLENLINQDGVEVNTYFLKKDEDALVLPNDTVQEINQVCLSYTLSYSLLSIPFWILLFYGQMRRLIYHYWYLPRYGDKADSDL